MYRPIFFPVERASNVSLSLVAAGHSSLPSRETVGTGGLAELGQLCGLVSRPQSLPLRVAQPMLAHWAAWASQAAQGPGLSLPRGGRVLLWIWSYFAERVKPLSLFPKRWESGCCSHGFCLMIPPLQSLKIS